MENASLFNPFPVLNTPRLILRRLGIADAEDLFAMRSDPEVMKYIPRPLAVSIEEMTPFIAMIDGFIDTGERVNWGIQQLATGKIIGMIGYVKITPEHNRAEIGYSLTKDYQRQGYMKEALIRVITFGFDKMKLHSIEAIIDAENSASGGILESVGFTKEAYFREDFLHNGIYRNSVHYGLLHSDKVVSTTN